MPDSWEGCSAWEKYWLARLGRWTVPGQRYSHTDGMRAVIDATNRFQIVLEVSVTQVTL
jgi:hypothetical protein